MSGSLKKPKGESEDVNLMTNNTTAKRKRQTKWLKNQFTEEKKRLLSIFDRTPLSGVIKLVSIFGGP
jgi:tRNA A37 N6-isopentenylltransferase MiaA